MIKENKFIIVASDHRKQFIIVGSDQRKQFIIMCYGQREQIYNIEQGRKINEFVHNRIKLVVYIKMYIAYKSFFKYFL